MEHLRKGLFGALVLLHQQETNMLESEQEKKIRADIGGRMNKENSPEI